MRLPMICEDTRLRQFTAAFQGCFSVPQYRHFVTMLVALMQCQVRRTLTGIHHQVADIGSISGLSRFLASSPWNPAQIASVWRTRFDQQMLPVVQAEHAQQRLRRPHRPGRPPKTVVTGFLIGDDSTMQKVRGKKMQGSGYHYSSTHGKPVWGHSLMQSLYVVLGRQCPLEPQMYRQKQVCEAEGEKFQSKIDLMVRMIDTVVPIPNTVTHVLLDSWFTCKTIWKAARERGFLITSGMKKNRSIRIADPTIPKKRVWLKLTDYAATRSPTDYQAVTWTDQTGTTRTVWVHIIQTRVKKLYRCQVILIKDTPDAPPKEVRFWASSDLKADATTLLRTIAMRWTIEVFFADAKEELGLDQYQLMHADAIRRFWTIVLSAYLFLEEERARHTQACGRHVSIGECRRAIQQRHWANLISWMHHQWDRGTSPQSLIERLVA